jgi:hypothetical protein
MRKSLKFILGMSSAVLISNAAYAAKAQLIPIVPFPGATSTTVFGIADDNNTITGSYIDGDGFTHGFYGTLDGNYTEFNFGDSDFTQARGIDGSGTLIAGFSNNDGNHCDLQEFEYDLGAGKLKAIKKGNKALNGEAQAINSKGEFAGDYCDTGGSGTIFGYLGQKFKWKSDVTTPFDSGFTGERGVNKKGTVVGFYINSDSGSQIGTLIQGGTTSQVTYPDQSEVSTALEGINDSGLASGQWGDSNGIVHGFSYDSSSSTFVEIDDPNATQFTQTWGVNKAGLIAVSSDFGSYIYCTLKKSKCPTTGAAAIEVDVKTVHVAPGKMLRYGDGHAAGHAVPKLALPKGAALQ